MNEFLMNVIEQRLARTADALRKNNMDAYIAENADEAKETVRSLLHDGDSIGLGGSVTLSQCGILDLVREPRYRLIDRYETGLSREENRARLVASLSADVFISGTNALTEDGVLYNVDGNGNRVAAIAFGPASVIIVAGYNKIVPTLGDAIERVKTVAAPANCKRLSCKSVCAVTGVCQSVADGSAVMCDGCSAEGRICCDYLVSAYQRTKGRIKVVLVKEELGF